MPPVDRLKPIRAKSSESGYTPIEFMRNSPTTPTCIEHLWRSRYAPDGETAHYPKCDTERGFKRYQTKQRRRPGDLTAERPIQRRRNSRS